MGDSPLKAPKIENQAGPPALNYDVLIYLFKYLSVKMLRVCAQVCQSWRQAAYDPVFWRESAPLYKDFNALSVDTAKSFKERGIKNIKLGAIELNEASLSTMFLNLSEHVEVENLIFVGLLTEHGITRHLPPSFPSLIRLNLHHSSLDVITEDGLRTLLTPMVNLQQLFISEYYGWKYKERKGKDKIANKEQPGFDYFEVVFSCLPKLTALDVTILGAWNGLANLEKTTDAPVPNLLQLAFYDDDQPNDCREVIEKASRKFPNLKHLELGISNNTGDDFDEFDTEFKNLESLYLHQSSCNILIPDILISICHGCSNLKALDVNVSSPYFGLEMDDNVILNVLHKCLNTLRVINISGHGTTLKVWNKHLLPNLVNLEVLVLGIFFLHVEKCTEEKVKFLNNVRSHTPNLISLQGILITEAEYDSLPSLKYITKQPHIHVDSCSLDYYITTRSDRHMTSRLLSDQTKSTWVDVVSGTPQWSEAMGSKYFILPDGMPLHDL